MPQTHTDGNPEDEDEGLKAVNIPYVKLRYSWEDYAGNCCNSNSDDEQDDLEHYATYAPLPRVDGSDIRILIDLGGSDAERV